MSSLQYFNDPETEAQGCRAVGVELKGQRGSERDCSTLTARNPSPEFP